METAMLFPYIIIKECMNEEVTKQLLQKAYKKLLQVFLSM